MKKTLRLMLIMALFICNMGMFANNYDDESAQVTIGSGTELDQSCPFVTKYCYSWHETIYSGVEIGGACTINAISYNCNVTNQPYEYKLSEIDVYMAVVDKAAFNSEADWIPAEKLIKVYSGENVVIGDTSWEKIVLDVPFYFNGKGNLVVAVAKKSYDYNSNLKWYYSDDDVTYTLYHANDGNENIADVAPTTAETGTRLSYRANIMLDVVFGEVASPIVVTPNPIDLGLRPAAAWMRPMTVEFSTESQSANILSIESTSPSFVVSSFQAPAEVTAEKPFSVSVKHANSNVIGELKGELKVANNFGTDVIEIKATTYSPVTSDVWEKAEEVTYYPYASTPDFDNLHDNYLLPGEAQDGPDAVYKLTFSEETSLSVAVNGTNAKMALYASNFGGKGGPDYDNYYGAATDPDQPTEPEFPEVELPEVQGNTFSYDFDDENIEPWRTIDADGDNFNWEIITSGAGAGVKCLASYSYNSSTSSKLDPDNYIVTKGSYSIDKNSVLEFDVKALDVDYYRDETYAVVVSVDGMNFETIGKETCTDAEWNHRTISLSDYAGQDVVIGFRHFDVGTKSYAILVDNVVLTPGRGAKYTKTEKYTVPAGTYYLAVSATERFSLNINATTEGGFNPVTEVYAQEIDDNSVDVKWSWDFITKEVRFSNGKSLSKSNRNENDEATVLGYNVCRKNTLNDEIIMIAENVADTAYIDNLWNEASMGLYQWGVSVIYDNEGENYETPVAYSNIIGKDMFTSLDIAVATENGTSAAGAKVSFVNVKEPSFKYEATLDETGAYHWDSFRRGTYRYTVTLDGYKPFSTESTVEIWDATTIECTLDAIFSLGDLFVSSTGWAMWNLNNVDAAETYRVELDGELVAETWDYYYQFDESKLEVGKEYTTTIIGENKYEYKWTYIPCDNLVQATNFEAEIEGKEAHLYWTLPVQGYSDEVSQFKFDFEDETLNGWITIDADGDGYRWTNSKDYSQTECGYQSWYSAMSHSCVGLNALNPDNYMATAKKYYITENSKLKFNVSAESAMFSQEHYGVAISTKSNYMAADFETIWEETLPKDENASNYHGTWYSKTIDLSEYAGQSVYIAFRHFNCSDQFWINIDNVELVAEEQTRKEDGEWLYYDNGENYDAIILQGGTKFYWGLMFPAADMAEFAGKSLTKISMFDFSQHDGKFMIYLGGLTAPGTLVHSQDYSCTGTKEYVEYELTSAVDIDGEQNVWVVFYGEAAACCVGPVESNGRWFSQDGTNWVDILNATGYNVTWQVRAFVEEVPIPNSTDLEVFGAMIFRDGVLKTAAPIKTDEFVETLPEYGDYEYTMRVVYGGEESTYYAMSCPLTVSLNHEIICQAPKNLHGESTLNPDGTMGATLVWPYTLKGSEWLSYDDGIHETGLGGTSLYWGIMFPTEALEFYDGTYVSKVALYDREAHEGNILIYYGGDNAPEILVHSQPYTATGCQDYVEYNLTAPIPVDATMNLWVVFNNKNGSWPASCCKNTGDKNGRWISTDGEFWTDIATVQGMDYTWMIRAFVTSELRGTIVPMKPLEMVDNTYSDFAVENIMADPRRNEKVFSNYNVYRGTSLDNMEIVGQPTEGNYFDEVKTGKYYYQVTATYFEGDIECESAPANSYLDPESDYIMVEVTSVNENGINALMIYPNPTQGNLNITAEALSRITIVNALGQVMYDMNANSDTQIINMSQYDAGVYMVRITTENGVSVQRITVVK